MEKLKTEKTGWLISDCLLACCITAEMLFVHSTVSQVFLALFCISALWNVWRRKRYVPETFFLFYAGIILWGAFCAVSGRAVDRDVALSMVRTMIIDAVYLFLLFQYLTLRDEREQAFRFIIAAAVATLIGVMIITWPDVLTDRLGRQYGYSPNILSTLFEAGFSLAVYLFLKRKHWADFLCAGVLLCGVFLTGCRRGIVVAVLILCVLVLWMNRNRFWKTLLIILGAAAVAAVLCYFVPVLHRIVWKRMVKGFNAILTIGNGVRTDASVTSRTRFIEEAVPLIREHPFTGIGLDCFYLLERKGMYSHNNYIELLVSGGIPALLLFYVPVVLILIRNIRLSGKSDAAKLGACLAARVLITGITVVSYYERPELLFVILAAAIAASEGNRKPRTLRVGKGIRHP